LAATLHDVGKLAIPRDTLNNPFALSRLERDAIREHPENGERMLAPFVRNPKVLAVVRSHHERWDGGGYPDGLAGNRIPLFARMIAIADTFDAMTSARSYRPAVLPDQAFEVLRAESGRQFDPTLIAAFLSTMTGE